MIIRKATLQDSKEVAMYLFLAMESIVYYFIGEVNMAKGKQFMLHLVENRGNQYSYENCWVAEHEGHVVAAVNVYDGGQLDLLRQPVIDHLRNNFDRDFIAEDETQAGEWYVDTLGVDPRMQGKGIGTKLLQFIIDDIVTARHQTLGLLVDEDNPDARRMYLKLGFQHVGTRTLFGKQMQHLQVNKSA